MKEYQPIMKNLKNISLRNRNLISDDQMKVVTVPNSEKLNELLNDMTISTGRESPLSPLNKQFNHTYLNEDFRNVAESRGKNIWHKTLIAENKRERQYEKDTHNYFLNRVLNQNNLSKITGLTT